jgi:peroxiredoxin/TolA-binding protein
VTHLKRGEEAPAFTLNDMAADAVSTEKLRGTILVTVFGEPFHDRTRQACSEIEAILNDPRLKGLPIRSVLVTAQQIKPEDLRLEAGQRLPTTILRDPDRRVFGQYRVAVLPSVVVIDKEGRVVHAAAGHTARLADVVLDSLLFASGKLSAEQLDKALNPEPTTAATSDFRAERTLQLARQLARRGMDELAMEKHLEALQLDPKLMAAHLDLGMLLLKQRRLADAEAQFRAVLSEQPTSMQAQLGLAFVQTQRGGRELDEAEKTVRELLARNPNLARAHYLLGLISEQRNKSDDAAASFKKAAQLLMERGDEE